MLTPISLLDREEKLVIAAIASNGIFHPTALKTVKKNFGDPLLAVRLKIKAVFDCPQIKANDKIGLRNFQKHLKICNSWLCSTGYKAPLLSSENITKALICLPHNIRHDFYKATKKSNFDNGSVNLIERWLASHVQNYFNSLANIVAIHEKQKTNNERNNKLIVNLTKMHSDINEHLSANLILKCWLPKNNQRLMDCPSFKNRSISRKKTVCKRKETLFPLSFQNSYC